MFCITGQFSILAYIWLVLVLVVISKDLIEIWEAVLTFLFFPLLVIIAYSADKLLSQPHTTSTFSTSWAQWSTW